MQMCGLSSGGRGLRVGEEEERGTDGEVRTDRCAPPCVKSTWEAAL